LTPPILVTLYKEVKMVAGGVSITDNALLADAYGGAGYKGLFKNNFVLFLSAFASIGGFLFGYDQGVISGILVMNNFVCLITFQLALTR
jgi:hypothetical protein